jgi:hypothetical protein
MRTLADFPGLRSLILASPGCHATSAETAKEEILHHLAVEQLDEVLRIEALTAVRCEYFFDHHDNEAIEVTAFLDEYGRARAKIAAISSSTADQRDCSLPRSVAESIAVLRLQGAVQEIADDYCRSVELPSSIQAESKPSNLSKMETLRLHRGIYRYQIYCNLFGGQQNLLARQRTGRMDRAKRAEKQRLLECFLPTFPPWEIQEIACIWQYMGRRWASILREVASVVDPELGSYGSTGYNLWNGAFAHLRLDSTSGTSFLVNSLHPNPDYSAIPLSSLSQFQYAPPPLGHPLTNIPELSRRSRTQLLTRSRCLPRTPRIPHPPRPSLPCHNPLQISPH